MRYMQDSLAYNHLDYMQESNLTNPISNPNPLTLTISAKLMYIA